jgi:hypothetical protein
VSTQIKRSSVRAIRPRRSWRPDLNNASHNVTTCSSR